MKKGNFVGSKTKGKVSYIFEEPKTYKSLIVFAHGAGTDMNHNSMKDLTKELLEKKIAVFRFNFPYKESGKGAPNPQPVLLETIRNAIEKARTLAPKKKIYAGGKSMGGRMTSILLSQEKIFDVKGLIYFGFPLHAVGRPSIDRGDHLKKIKLPMLFLSGTRDTMGDSKLIKKLCSKLGSKTKLLHLEGADHSFKVLKSGPKTYEGVIAEVGTAVAKFAKA